MNFDITIKELKKAKREVSRLRKIEHAAWHLLDDSEHRMDSGEIVVQKENFDALSALLSEGHPE